MPRKDANVSLNCLRIQPEADLTAPLEKRVQKATEEINRVLERYGLTLQVINDISLSPIE